MGNRGSLAHIAEQLCKDAYEDKVLGRDPPARGYEAPFVTRARTCACVLCLLYPLIIGTQRKINHGKFPSTRFDSMRGSIWLHILVGSIIIFYVPFLHFEDLVAPVSAKADEALWRQLSYLVLAYSGIIHSLTVLKVVGKVMGEKRVTVALYLGAGAINMYNSVELALDPGLRKAFLLFGSMSTFVYVRFFIVAFGFSKIDWELNYTYSILAAAATAYPLSQQRPVVYTLLAMPVLYGPFHERVCRWLGWDPEDTLGGNMPSNKNLALYHMIGAKVRYEMLKLVHLEQLGAAEDLLAAQRHSLSSSIAASIAQDLQEARRAYDRHYSHRREDDGSTASTSPISRASGATNHKDSGVRSTYHARRTSRSTSSMHNGTCSQEFEDGRLFQSVRRAERRRRSSIECLVETFQHFEGAEKGSAVAPARSPARSPRERSFSWSRSISLELASIEEEYKVQKPLRKHSPLAQKQGTASTVVWPDASYT